MRVLVVNAGSSSLKLRVLDDDAVVASEDLPALKDDAEHAVAGFLSRSRGVDAVGHRIVHGGGFFDGPVRVDAAVRARLESLVPLAPLHQPHALAALDAVARNLPGTPAVACFDTAFHASLAPAAATYAIPREWRERYGVRRYGFHGLSHGYVARRVAELLHDRSEELRIVSCHLGAGASLAASLGGRSIDTTMGFTPLEGLVMATRAGSVDPGILLWLQQEGGHSVDDIADALEHRSGLTGLAGTGDMREVVAAASDGSADARLALDVYVHRLGAGIAAMAASMNGMDALVFTGGVGENASSIRARTADRVSFLGVAVDRGRNEAATADADVSSRDAGVRTLVVTSREDVEIARQVRRTLAGGPP